MEDSQKFKLGGENQTAAKLYGELKGKRTGVEQLGRLMAELTIPSVFPPEGYEGGDNLPGNNQSLGAHCLNNLASSLTFMAFPPGQPIAKFKAFDYEMQDEIDQDPQLWARMEVALSRLELAHRERLAVTNLQTAYGGYIKTLLVTGNALWKHVFFDSPMYFRPDTYVVKRNVAGFPLITILQEDVELMGLEPDIKSQLEAILEDDEDQKGKEDWQKKACIQSVCKLHVSETGEKTWLYWQECKGHFLEGTEVEADLEYPPMWAGWLIPVYGSDWGRSYCEEYRGDLFTLEANSSALNDGAALAALSLTFVKPGSQTSIKQVREARNLSTLPGDAADVTTFTTNKNADMNFVSSNIEMVGRRLAQAFLLQVGIQRSGERVTAEEVRRIGTELDKALGGLYTQIAQGNQKVIIKRAMRLNEDENKLPALPSGKVEVQVITGIDAMGNSTEYDNLIEWATANKGVYPESFEKSTNGRDFHLRTAAAKGIKPDGLVKSEDELAADNQQTQQQQMMQSLLDKGTGPAVKGLTDAAAMGQGGLPEEGMA